MIDTFKGIKGSKRQKQNVFLLLAYLFSNYVKVNFVFHFNVAMESDGERKVYSVKG